MDDLNVNSCRICFAANACVPLFDDREEFNVASLLEFAINIKVQLNEHISSLICSKCFEMINTTVKLKQSVELAEERWNKFFVYVWTSNRKEDIDQNMAHIKREEESSDNNDDNTDREGEYQVEDNSKQCPDSLELIKREIGTSDNNDSKSVVDCIQDFEVEPKLDDGISNGSNKISPKHETSLDCHLTVHTGVKNHKCENCNKSYSHKYLLTRHIQLIHYKEKGHPHPCTKCDKAFATLSRLRVHFRIHTGEKPFECKYCDLKFTQSSNLVKHTRRKHLKNNDQFKAMTSNVVINHNCEICNKSFIRKQLLISHIGEVHCKEKGHPCTKCDKTFRTPSHLKEHFRIHTGEKPFECKYCDLKFTQSTNLVKHTRRKHLKNNDQFKPIEKRYPCTKCDKTFHTSNDLSNHLRIHTGEKPFECKYCDSKFTHPSYLTAHTRRKHLNNNDRFKPMTSKVVKNHKCENCNKSYSYKYLLTRHIQFIHYNEKGHPCTKCDKSFRTRSHLTEHFRIHTGEKPFECKYCDWKFSQSGNLAVHIRRKHHSVAKKKKLK